ncbi:FAD binding domain-containing protein [Pseudonocardia acaciae]|uniref:FAD binding domain-containing protein n=1 Tax=Pseudonocardia acaciae TaxID=551276 RepID=UPI00048CEED0|nr:FAD binding domain-containing protein [Pseudonocardia acaciae]
MKPPPFAYARAGSVAEALELLADAGEDAKLLAGGQSLIPLLAYRLARPSHLVDIGRIPGLSDVATGPDGLRVQALVTHAALQSRADLTGPWRAVRECAGLIGHYPVRTRGTFGGSISHGDPSAELPVVALALEAEFVLRSPGGERLVRAEDFFAGPFMTVLEPTEMLVQARFPAAGAGRLSAFEEFSTRAGDFASAATAVALTPDETGRVHQVRIALGGVGPVPARAAEAEAALEGAPLDEAAIAAAARAAAADCRAGEDGALIPVLVERALRRIREER